MTKIYATAAVKIDGKQYNKGDILPKTAGDAATLERYSTKEVTPNEVVAEVKAPKAKPAKAAKVEESEKDIVPEDTTVKTEVTEGTENTEIQKDAEEVK